MERLAITGETGFLAWHLACQLRALRAAPAERWGRALIDDEALAERVAQVDTVFHVAGVNRAEPPESVEAGNVELAEKLGRAIIRAGHPVHVVYANSIHSDTDTPYGRGKERAAAILREATSAVGGSLGDVLLPNLFGEHGRPGYNSFVATFCAEVAAGRTPTIHEDREVPLLHAQDAAAALIAAADDRRDRLHHPRAVPRSVSGVLAELQAIASLYRTGEVPNLSDPFNRDLFNAYRSHLFPSAYPILPPLHSDARGSLFETLRSHGGTSQAFMSTTVPGATRGDHYHLRKVERFCVVKGQARISLRQLFGTEVIVFDVDGDNPGFIDMPTMWVHNLRNTGSSELVTMFWTDQLLDVDRPDQFPEKVDAAA